MPQVKGSILIPWVKPVRADKSGVFVKWLTEEDWTVISGRVFTSSWYPFETYKHIVTAVAKLLAHEDEKILHDWGSNGTRELLLGPYKSFIVSGSPTKSLTKCMSFRSLFFDFGSTEAKIISDSHAQVIISGFPSDFKVFYYLLNGWYTTFILFAGANDIKNEFINKSWEGDPSTIIDYKWR